MLRILPFLLVTLAASPALAAVTPWQDLAPGVRARLISSDTLSAGGTVAGLELDMPQTTKTYWRIPGETGIPTEFDFSASSGVTSPQVVWPYPEIDRSDGYLDYVFHGSLVVPISLAATAGATLNASITLGVCSDVCVPAQGKFSLPLNFARPDAAQSIRLDQALAAAPIPWDKPQGPFGSVTLSPDGASLAIQDPDPSIDPATVIADVGDPAVLLDTPQKSPDETVWTVKLLGGAGSKGLEGRPLQLTFMTSRGPYSVTRQIAAAP